MFLVSPFLSVRVQLQRRRCARMGGRGETCSLLFNGLFFAEGRIDREFYVALKGDEQGREKLGDVGFVAQTMVDGGVSRRRCADVVIPDAEASQEVAQLEEEAGIQLSLRLRLEDGF